MTTSQPWTAGSVLLTLLSLTLLSLTLSSLAGCSEALQTESSALQHSAPIGLVVDIDPASLPENIPAEAKLFVFIRTPHQTMPLDVRHYSADKIPTQIHFRGETQSQAVELVARLSYSGQVNKSADDLEFVRAASLTHPPATISVDFNVNRQVVAPTAPTVLVELASHLELAENLTVFVTAKALDNPMPLAVRKLQVADLPTRITLTDQDSLLLSHNLSSAKSYSLSAHVSMDGDASRKPGDWVSQTLANNTSQPAYTYQLLIESIID